MIILKIMKILKEITIKIKKRIKKKMTQMMNLEMIQIIKH
jgi:hypothetical protein